MNESRLTQTMSFPVEETKRRICVVDAGAAIKLQRVDTFGDEFYTTEEVYNEIKDKQARQFLSVLPFDLKIRQPSKEDFLAVQKFAKETGDLGFLSNNDMGLIALGVKLYKENGLLPELKTKPTLMNTKDQAQNRADGVHPCTASNHRRAFAWAPQEDKTTLFKDGKPRASTNSFGIDKAADFFKSESAQEFWEREGKNLIENQGDDQIELNTTKALSWAERARLAREVEVIAAAPIKKTVIDISTKKSLTDEEIIALEKEREAEKKKENLESNGRLNEESSEFPALAASSADTPEDVVPIVPIISSSTNLESDLELKPDDKELDQDFKPKSRILGVADTTIVLDTDDDESDDEGWVTSDNLGRLNNLVSCDKQELEEDNKCCSVSILSTDYSVQNVVIQMGLKALSCDGYRIRSVKLWAKICRACKWSTRDTSKMFCGKCGNGNTFDRCPITLDKEGNMVLHDNRRYAPNLRGTIYSIPKRQGGRKHNDLLLREDELMMGNRVRQHNYEKKLREKQAKSHEEGEWCSRPITGTGKTINSFMNSLQVGYGRKNPNANNFRRNKK